MSSPCDPISSAGGTSLWRHQDFRRYLTGQAASVAGSSISAMALPVLAVLELDASPAQVAWITFMGQLPPALLALYAGALADRRSKRKQMITGDLVSAAALASVPTAAALDRLSLTQLMVVAAVQGAAGVLHDAAAISLLPSLVDRSLIQRSNSRIGAVFAVAATAGSNLGAGLTALLGPARALLGDVGSYLVSAWCTARIQTRETTRAQAGSHRVHTEIGEGLRYVHRDHRLRTLTLVNATTSFALALLNTLWALYLLKSLSMSPTAFGVVLGLGALGAAAGALAAPALTRRYGAGPMMLVALALTPLTQIPLLLASPALTWQIGIGAALFLQLACAAAAGTTQRSIRQVVTADDMQARMQAVSTWLTSGARPVAALVAGGLGTRIGVRPTLIVGTCLLLVPLVVLYRSPLRGLRQMPGAQPAPSHPGDPLVQPPVPSPSPSPGAAPADDGQRNPAVGGGGTA
ncbi:MFS transporter permease [Streptomyces bungoensis]|uniref:MFS transporter permease n=1 Tax=Streptomyces bungoensis TaxID=285568 RepID=A0A117RGS8_9ACTN|nr:MFS transporter [Streptomyces bungoensis]KUN90061.1 MFS transporter permease [Streptomyces bungoensis]